MDLPRKYLTSIAQNQFLKRRLFFNHNSIFVLYCNFSTNWIHYSTVISTRSIQCFQMIRNSQIPLYRGGNKNQQLQLAQYLKQLLSFEILAKISTMEMQIAISSSNFTTKICDQVPSFDQVPSDLETTTNIRTDVSSLFRFVVAAVVAAIRKIFQDSRKIELTKKNGSRNITTEVRFTTTDHYFSQRCNSKFRNIF